MNDLEVYQIEYNHGVDAMESGNAEHAIELFLSSINKRPDVAALWTGLGKAQMMLDRTDQAATSFETACLLDPSNPKPKYNLAMLFMKKGDLAAAVSHAIEARNADPTGEIGNTMLVKIYMLQDNYEDAIRAFQAVDTQCPDQADTLAYTVIKAFIETSRFEEGVGIADRALAYLRMSDDLPENARIQLSCRVWQELAVLYQNLGRFEEAVSCYELIEPIYKTNFDFWNNRGNACRGAKMYEKSATYLRLALDLCPKHPIALFNLALTYHNMGPDGIVEFHETCKTLREVHPQFASQLSFD